MPSAPDPTEPRPAEPAPATEPAATDAEPGPATTAPEPAAAARATTEPQPAAAAQEPATAPATTGATASEPAPAAATTPGRRLRRLLPLAGLGVVVVALAVALLLVTLALQHRRAADDARAGALAAAQHDAVALAAYDYRHLDADFAAVLAQATPSFARTYTQSSAALKSVLVKYRATATARVVAAGIETGTADRATVLVFLDQTVTNSSQKGGPSSTQSRLQLDLQHSGGRWLIDQVKLL